MEILKIEKKETLDSLLKFSNDFKFDNSMFKNGAKLIDINQYNVIKKGLDSVVKYGSKTEKEQMFS